MSCHGIPFLGGSLLDLATENLFRGEERSKYQVHVLIVKHVILISGHQWDPIRSRTLASNISRPAAWAVSFGTKG